MTADKLSRLFPKIFNAEVDQNASIVIDGNLLGYPTTVITANYTPSPSDSLILANATGAAITVTLPNATLGNVANRSFTIKKTDSSANAITIATTASQTIDGASTQTLSNQYQDITVVSDGANWQAIQSPSISSGLPLTGGTLTGALIINKSSSGALVVGPNGATNPTLQVVTNVASAATGLSVTGNAAGSGVTLTALSSGANENLIFKSKGTGIVQFQPGTDSTLTTQFINAGGTNAVLSVDTTNNRVAIGAATSAPSNNLDVFGTFDCRSTAQIAATVNVAGGGAKAFTMGSSDAIGVYFGSGVPTVSAPKGSLYMRTDGTTTNNRAYINTDGGTTWTALTTAA